MVKYTQDTQVTTRVTTQITTEITSQVKRVQVKEDMQLEPAIQVKNVSPTQEIRRFLETKQLLKVGNVPEKPKSQHPEVQSLPLKVKIEDLIAEERKERPMPLDDLWGKEHHVGSDTVARLAAKEQGDTTEELGAEGQQVVHDATSATATAAPTFEFYSDEVTSQWRDED